MTTTERLTTRIVEDSDDSVVDSSEKQSGFVEESLTVSSDNDFSPEDLASFSDGILGMFVAIDRISSRDKIALQTTGSRAGKVTWQVKKKLDQ